MKKKLVILPMIAIMVIGIMFSPVRVLAIEVLGNSEELVQKEDYLKFASDIVEKYYRNKDLGENNDFSNNVSSDLMKLLATKIEMGQLQNQILDLNYKDYQIEINPYQTKEWVESENEIFMILRVERSWFYSSDKTTSSELQEITLSKNESGDMQMVGCYGSMSILWTKI